LPFGTKVLNEKVIEVLKVHNKVNLMLIPISDSPDFSFWVFALVISLIAGLLLDIANVLWADTGFAFTLAILMAYQGFKWSAIGGLNELYLRDNSAIGLTRLSVVVSLLWGIFVVLFFADPTIEGLWTPMYAINSYAATKFFGQHLGQRFGPRLRRDVYERKNVSAAVLLGSFTLATGLIYGAAMWGAVVPGALDYGGIFQRLPGYSDAWWITPWFFFMGWVVLVVSLRIWLAQEPYNVFDRIVRDRSIPEAVVSALFILANGLVIAHATHGDYLGLAESHASFFVFLLPVAALHLFARLRRSSSTDDRAREGFTYVGLAIGGILVVRVLAATLFVQV